MRWGGLVAILLLVGCAGNPPRNLSASGNALSPEGWRGKRYYENGQVISEEFDAVGNDGRIDLWRYYHNGVLLTEDRDRDSDGRIDYTAHYALKSGALDGFARDTDFDGQNDIWLRNLENDRWALNWDRNHDGAVDFVFVFRCSAAAFASLPFDPLEITDMREIVPAAQWVELDIDEDHNQRFDRWIRYKDGKEAAMGVDENGDGYPERWAKVEEAAPVKVAKGDSPKKAAGAQHPKKPAGKQASIIGVEAADVEIPGKTAPPDEEEPIEETSSSKGAGRGQPAARASAQRQPAERAGPEVPPRASAEESRAGAVPANLPAEE